MRTKVAIEYTIDDYQIYVIEEQTGILRILGHELDLIFEIETDASHFAHNLPLKFDGGSVRSGRRLIVRNHSADDPALHIALSAINQHLIVFYNTTLNAKPYVEFHKKDGLRFFVREVNGEPVVAIGLRVYLNKLKTEWYEVQGYEILTPGNVFCWSHMIDSVNQQLAAKFVAERLRYSQIAIA